MKKTLLALAIPLLAMCTPASAAVIITTVNGNLLPANGSGGGIPSIFGLGADYAGVAFNVVFTFDDATLGADRTDDGVRSSLSGVGPLACGGCFGSPGSAVVTINGISRTVGNDNGSRLARDLSSSPRGFYSADTTGPIPGASGGSTESTSINFQGENIFQLSNLTEAFSRTTQTDDFGSFFYTYYDSSFPADSISLNGSISDINVRVSGAVPEPAAWAMMITGFGLVGGSLRRRRQTTKLAVLA